MKKDKTIRGILRKNEHQKVLDYLAKASGYNKGNLNKAGVISAVTQEVFFGKKGGLGKAISAIKTLSDPEYKIIEVDENYIKVTEKTLKYASE